MSDERGRQKLIVALDVESAAQALDLAAQLSPLAGGFKVGSRLFTLEGPSIVKRLVDSGARVFLDLKFHDIPNQIAQTVDAAVQTGAWMINVHASGGVPMMRAALQSAAEAADALGRAAPLVIAVTVLTSMDARTLHDLGISRSLLDHVLALAQLTQQAGLDGVVASPQETTAIRQMCGPQFVVVTPGIRGAAAGADKHDQARTMGPREAVRAGASYIVVGRPIIAAADPRHAAEKIVEELES
jgi:orotidine-5'-phosphate decarboxylase